MTKCEDTVAAKQVLGWVNRQRAELGLAPIQQLRKGHPLDAEACVIAGSIATVKGVSCVVGPSDVETDGEFYASWGGRVIEGDLPQYVNQFALRFDEGKFPSLEIAGS